MHTQSPDPVSQAIEASLALLAEYAPADGPRADAAGMTAGALPDLLADCAALADKASVSAVDPIRLVHHFACTGGTLICRALALQPNTLLLSEIDPLSSHGINPQRPQFTPTDIIRHLRYSFRPVPDEVVADVFLAALGQVADWTERSGKSLILRDHTHPYFCSGTEPLTRPDLRQVVLRQYPVRSVITVRHPLDSYLSLLVQKWESFVPRGLDEYARRYLLFLEAHPDTVIFKYEDFVADPSAGLAGICAELELPVRPVTDRMLDAIHLTGDSGRSGSAIQPRTRRAIPDHLQRAISNSRNYRRLCERLGYPDAT